METNNTNDTTSPTLYDWTQIIDALHALSKRSEVTGTWLESHFRWQIRTFWFGLLWAGLTLFVIATFGVGIVVAWLPLGLLAIWFIYRVARGWIALRERRPMYV